MTEIILTLPISDDNLENLGNAQNQTKTQINRNNVITSVETVNLTRYITFANNIQQQKLILSLRHACWEAANIYGNVRPMWVDFLLQVKPR